MRLTDAVSTRAGVYLTYPPRWCTKNKVLALRLLDSARLDVGNVFVGRLVYAQINDFERKSAPAFREAAAQWSVQVSFVRRSTSVQIPNRDVNARNLKSVICTRKLNLSAEKSESVYLHKKSGC